MIVFKIITVLTVAIAVRAEKKIELQDIEEDNLRGEKEKEYDKYDDSTTQINGAGTDSGNVPLEFLKSGFFRYFENPTVAPQQEQPRYVHQYDVTEPPERPQPESKAQHGLPVAQQAMLGYLSNVPMQIYLVPQYNYPEKSGQPTNPHMSTSYKSSRVTNYQTAPEAVQTQTNYIEVPPYSVSTGKSYTQQHSPAVTYIPANPSIVPPSSKVAPALAYHVPVVHYTHPVSSSNSPKTYYHSPQYTETNSIDYVQGHEDDQRQYSTQLEIPYHKPVSAYPRHYNSRAPYRDDYRGQTNIISELPRPNPILLKAPPPHLAHIPKVLPMQRPLSKPVYQETSETAPGFTSRPHEYYSYPFKKRPTSLLDSYIPSSIQVEYLKRGLIKDPLAVYDALASGRLPHPIPRHYERGFLPNQMYPTAAGGFTFSHHKRSPKSDKSKHK